MIQSLSDGIELSFIGKQIKPVTSGKGLGVIVDSHLTYDNHINATVSSCMSKLCQINRVKDSLDKGTLFLIISALVLSKLYYCLSVWSNTSATNVNKLQAVQNFACKIVTKARKYDDVTPSMKELKWLPVKEHLLYQDTIMTCKYMNAMASHYLCSNFCKRTSIHGRPTSNSNLLQIPLYSTASGQRTFKYRALKIWSQLSSDQKELKIFKNFRLKLRSSLLENVYNK